MAPGYTEWWSPGEEPPGRHLRKVLGKMWGTLVAKVIEGGP